MASSQNLTTCQKFTIGLMIIASIVVSVIALGVLSWTVTQWIIGNMTPASKGSIQVLGAPLVPILCYEGINWYIKHKKIPPA